MGNKLPGLYLAFDPGDTTGFCVFDSEGEIVTVGQFSFTELDDWFFEFDERFPNRPVLKIICEEFRIFNNKSQAFVGNKLVVSQVIGLIRSFARRRGVDVVMQPPTHKSVAERLTGTKVVGAHSNTHFQDAYLHGAFWLIKNGILETKLEREYRERKQNEAVNKDEESPSGSS